MGKCFYWPGMASRIETFVKSCDTCQKNKSSNIKKYGLLPLKHNPKINVWDILTVDLMGPWKMKAYFNQTKTYEEIKLWSLTMVDELSRWLEIKVIVNKSSKNIAELVDTQWFCQYPCPLYIIHNNGGEFISNEFVELLDSYSIKKKPTTVKNLQANTIIEPVHLVLGEMCRVQEILLFENNDPATVHEGVRRVLQSLAFAIKTTVHSTNGYSPAELVFNRNMIMHCKAVVEWDLVRNRYCEEQMKNHERENKTRIPYEYKVGERALIITKRNERAGKIRKYEHKGPFKISAVHKKGTVTLKKDGYIKTILLGV
mmetsp:Transcript_2310/g.3250  ORF Transcript_2310/g.3250 Transcript_2310/m.3250 type:complete len:314 (-) Transcript_2310:250-1191(-)